MNIQITMATAKRVIQQLIADKRSMGLIVLVPSALLILLYFVYYNNERLFDRIALMMLGVFPLLLMFLITSITMQRERASGTLERLLTTKLHRADLLAGYGLAFSIAAIVQSLVTIIVVHWILGADTAVNIGWVFLVTPLTAITGVALGLFTSAFAKSEFQAVQFMPIVIGPQFFLCGVLVAKEQMPQVLQWISDFMPLTYAVTILQHLTTDSELYSGFAGDLGIIALFAVFFLALAALTMPRQTN